MPAYSLAGKMPRIIIPRTKIKKESLTSKRTSIFIGLTTAAAAAVCGGYILFLAVLAPQQLAEATTAATNLVCNGCVGSGDIADGSIQSRDIRDGQVGSVDIGQGQVARGDIQNDAIRPNILEINGDVVTVNPNESKHSFIDCPPGTKVTGGGYSMSADPDIVVYENGKTGSESWIVNVFNGDTSSISFHGEVYCIGPMP